tara:strand:+ start:271 stop:528 length:258 start_codon:yes stop_codon:yes gene_type:complete
LKLFQKIKETAMISTADENAEDIVELDKRMSSHEAMCEERWKTCFNRLNDLDDSIKRLESILIAAAGGALVGGLGVLATILTMHL